jgi:hypothetical protein
MAFATGMVASDYEREMGKALKKYKSCETAEQFASTAEVFGSISSEHSKQWLPRYYQAHCLIISSFLVGDDPDLRDGYLDIAEPIIETMLDEFGGEVEIVTLQSLFYSARLMVNPSMRGMKYGMRSTKTSQKAMEIDASNPRVQFMRIRNEMGKASFLGRDVQTYCAQAQAVLTSFDLYKPESSLHPSWGKKELKDLIQSCND